MIEQLFVAVNAQRRYRRSLQLLVIALLVASPFVVHFVWGERYAPAWSAEVIRSSLSDGTFWLSPGPAVFQQTQALIDTNATGVGAIVMVAIIAVIFVVSDVIIFVTLFYLLRWLLKLVSTRGARGSLRLKPIDIPREGKLLHLLPTLRVLLESDAVPGTAQPIAMSGSSLVFRKQLEAPLPDMYFDSRSNDMAGREGILMKFDSKTEVIFDGTTSEYFSIYVAPTMVDDAPKLFDAELLSLLVKRLDQADIIVEGKDLTAIVDIRAIGSSKDITQYMADIDGFATALVVKAVRANLVNTEPLTPTEIVSVVGVRQWLAVSSQLVGVIACLVIVYLAFVACISGGLSSVSDAMMVAWAAVVCVLVGLYVKASRKASVL